MVFLYALRHSQWPPPFGSAVLTAESGAEMRMQPASRVSYTRFVQKDDGAVLAITLLPETDGGWWAAVAG